MKLKKVVIMFICLLVFGVFNSTVYATPKKASPQIKSIGNLVITITQTDSFVLPTALKAKMSNGSNKSVSVIWDKKVDYNQVGVQRFSGNVKGYKNKVLLTLNIKDEANFEKIKKMSLYTFELKDENGDFYNVYVYEVNSKKKIATFKNGAVWAGASEGEVLYTGNMKIAYSKAGSKDVKVFHSYPRHEDGTEPKTINTSRKLIKKIETKYAGERDLLLIAEVLCSNASGINIYYINNGDLKQMQGDLSTCNAYELFFRQVDANIFERSAYDNTEGFFYVMKNKFDFNTGAIKNISEDKMTIKEYEEYIKNADKDTNIDKGNDSGEINFPDKNLEKVIRSEIKKNSGKILKSDVDKITSLNAFENNITNLEGIENLTNLTKLDLELNEISNIEPLGGLINLTDLILDRNQIGNIDSLKGLINLTSLSLNGNNITNMEPLSGLTKLTALGLGSNKIRNIEFLKRLPNLTDLNLYDCKISNIEALRELTNLTKLSLSGNQIQDYSPVSSYYNNLKYKDFTLSNKITPIIKVSTVTLNKTTGNLVVGSTDNLIATVSPSNATNKDVIWTSSNTEVATVDNTGKVTAVSAGTANITVTTVDGGKTSDCTILNEQNYFSTLVGVPKPTGLDYERNTYSRDLTKSYYNYNNEIFDINAYTKLLNSYGWINSSITNYDESVNSSSTYYGGKPVSVFYFTKGEKWLNVELLRTEYGYELMRISGQLPLN